MGPLHRFRPVTSKAEKRNSAKLVLFLSLPLLVPGLLGWGNVLPLLLFSLLHGSFFAELEKKISLLWPSGAWLGMRRGCGTNPLTRSSAGLRLPFRKWLLPLQTAACLPALKLSSAQGGTCPGSESLGPRERLSLLSLSI